MLITVVKNDVHYLDFLDIIKIVSSFNFFPRVTKKRDMFKTLFSATKYIAIIACCMNFSYTTCKRRKLLCGETLYVEIA